MSLAIAGLGVLGVAAPALRLEFAGSLLAPPALYGVAAVRVVFGVLLVLVATESRTPRALRVIGVVLVVAGLLTPLFGTERLALFLTWFSGQAPLLIRLCACHQLSSPRRRLTHLWNQALRANRRGPVSPPTPDGSAPNPGAIQGIRTKTQRRCIQTISPPDYRLCANRRSLGQSNHRMPKCNLNRTLTQILLCAMPWMRSRPVAPH